MSTINIVRLDGIHSPALTLSPDFKHTYTEYPTTLPNNEIIIERLKEADVVITTRIPITKEVLEACPRLKLVAAMAIGTSPLPLPLYHISSHLKTQGLKMPQKHKILINQSKQSINTTLLTST
jgi:phosphoglycerate dehydrogenase-like enzyme